MENPQVSSALLLKLLLNTILNSILSMKFNPGFDIEPTTNPMGFVYGRCFWPPVENRLLKDIRKSLSDPDCDGPK